MSCEHLCAGSLSSEGEPALPYAVSEAVRHVPRVACRADHGVVRQNFSSRRSANAKASNV
ncbi:hypothetical protein G1C97_1443 [Bifidobacterium sp. DSM 109959]|uniref:Uncharacterized protein n=1 Tax=Bifidobacterium olomucense TaxID=2675324 RepID=A0A7Y0HWM9_9BIFI|nr:hypothetical protein [Bifidobacterium sp. DSM 109959]